MTPQERLERELARGLDDLAGTAGPPPIDDILAQTRQTRQRRAWLPFQRSTFPSGAPGLRIGTVAGRTLSMTPTFRYAAVAGLALALGVLFAPVLAPTTRPVADAPDPSAEAAPLDVVWATGAITPTSSCNDPKTSIEKGVGIHHRGYVCEPQVWEATDPRLTGTGSTTWNADTYPSAIGGQATINVASMTVTTAEGAWSCASSAVNTHGPVMFGYQVLPEDSTCTGSGAYDGMVAVVAIDNAATPPTFEAVILRGGLPPTP